MNGEPSFAVVGVGPVGSFMAVHLANAGHKVTLVDVLRVHMDEIKKSGLTLTGLKEANVRFSEGRICNTLDEIVGSDVNTVFISVKASILPRIVPLLSKVAKPGMTFISLQNGLDTEDYIAQAVGRENTLRIVVNYAGNIIGNGRIKMSFFNPPNYIGSITSGAKPRARELAKLITSTGLQTEYTDDIKRYEWEKTILNTALSPVCALTRRTMKQMMDHKDVRELVRLLLQEGFEVAEARGVRLGKDFVEHGMGYLDKAGHHKTSMNVDLEKGNQTEIDFINGKIVEHGKLAGVPTPYNSTIVALVKGSEIPNHKETT